MKILICVISLLLVHLAFANDDKKENHENRLDESRGNRPNYRRYGQRRYHHDRDNIYYPYPVYPYGSYYGYYPYYYYNYYNIRSRRHADELKSLVQYVCAKRGIALDPRPEFKTRWGVCSTNWVYCAAPDSEPQLMSCPADLRYDQQKEQCLSQVEIFACSGVRAPEERGELIPLDKDGEPMPTTTRSQPTPAPDGFCIGKGDGYYPMIDGVCSPEYVACVDDDGFLLKCPKGEAFYADEDRCEFFENLPHCGGERVKPRQKLVNVTDAEPQFICEKQGIIPDPSEPVITEWGVCSNIWFYCPGEQMIPEMMSCPADLYFDTEQELCLRKKQVYGCTGVQPETTTTKPVSTKTELSVNGFCALQPDGNYEWQGRCSEYFVICKDSLGYLISCPGLNRYHPTRNECVPINQCLN